MKISNYCTTCLKITCGLGNPLESNLQSQVLSVGELQGGAEVVDQLLEVGDLLLLADQLLLQLLFPGLEEEARQLGGGRLGSLAHKPSISCFAKPILFSILLSMTITFVSYCIVEAVSFGIHMTSGIACGSPSPKSIKKIAMLSISLSQWFPSIWRTVQNFWRPS